MGAWIGAASERNDRRGDSVVFFNFRADRAREITRALISDAFDRFERGPKPALARYTCFGTYDRTFPLPVAFPNESPTRILGELFSESGLRQLRIAETEKYAHVTFFFNGGREQPFTGEDRCLIPSPKVATYDLQPEMSAPEVTAALPEAAGPLDRLLPPELRERRHGRAHRDLRGGRRRVQAGRPVGPGRSSARSSLRNGAAFVTADHGNSEQMWDQATNSPHTAHTTNPVPAFFAGQALQGRRLREGGVLADVAPTLLDFLEIDQAAEMTGKSLLD
jgi:2,3-bisphosphoglycerate-independent phosphoglycerate mutase